MCRNASVLGVDRAAADRAGRQEDVGIALVDRQLDREAPRRHRPEAGRRQRVLLGDLALALRPDDRIDLGLEDVARIGRQIELGFVAGLDLVQLVLVVQRDDLVGLLDEGHRRRDREGRRERAGAQLHVDRVAVGGRDDGRLLELPVRVFELGADLRHRRVVGADLAGQALAHLALARRGLGHGAARLGQHAARGVELRFERLDDRSRPARARSGRRRRCDQLAVVGDALARQLDLRQHFAHAGFGLLHRALRRGQAADGAADLLDHLAAARLGVGELRLQALDLSSYGVGSMRNSTSPFFTSRFGSTGTSITRPPTCGTMLTTYLMTRTSRSTARPR